MQHKTLNLGGKLTILDQPLVMAIVNATPDSFYAQSRAQSEQDLLARLTQIQSEGADMIDLGAYSTRPNAPEVSEAEEKQRLRPALELIRRHMPDMPISVDTFRSEVARWAVGEYGVEMINDISGGSLDARMFATVAELQVPYVLMHMRGTPQTMQAMTDYADLRMEVIDYFTQRIGQLLELGLHDVVLDLGFGFAKTLEQNYELLAFAPEVRCLLERPMLVGLSRKSMIYRLLDTTAQEALNGTTALNAYALSTGSADILRVHDVRAARECIRLISACRAVEYHDPSIVEVFTQTNK